MPFGEHKIAVKSDNLAHCSRLNGPLRRLRPGTMIEAKHLTTHARRLNCGDNGVGVGHAARHGLIQIEVFAGLSASNGYTPAPLMFRANANNIHILASQCFIKIGDIGEIHFGSELPIPISAAWRYIGFIGHCHKATSWVCREE
jgi:hypothetical protein